MSGAVSTCGVVYNETCKSPANLAPPVPCRARCFACGNAVCTAPACSRVVAWYRMGRQRICRSCLEERRREQEPMWEVAIAGLWWEVFAKTPDDAREQATEQAGWKPGAVSDLVVRPANEPARDVLARQARKCKGGVR